MLYYTILSILCYAMLCYAILLVTMLCYGTLRRPLPATPRTRTPVSWGRTDPRQARSFCFWLRCSFFVCVSLVSSVYMFVVWFYSFMLCLSLPGVLSPRRISPYSSCDIHTHTVPLPKQVMQTSSCTMLLYTFVIQTVLGLGMGMNVTAQYYDSGLIIILISRGRIPRPIGDLQEMLGRRRDTLSREIGRRFGSLAHGDAYGRELHTNMKWNQAAPHRRQQHHRAATSPPHRRQH